MAYALVGAVGAVSTGASGAAVTPAYGAGASRTANNLLILHVLTTGSATLPAAPAGWSVAKQQAGTSCSASIFYKIAAGADAAPTVALVAAAIHNARLSEFSGGVTSTPLDQTAGANGTATPLVATAAAADVGAGDLVIGCGGAINSAARANTMAHTINNGVVDTETTNGATSTVSHYDFTYGTTTGKASADSDSFAFVTTQLTGAVIALASFKIPTVAYNDSRSGTVVASGTGSDEYLFPTPYDAVIDIDNPVSHWKLGSSSSAFDRKGVRNLPAVNGPVAVVSGITTNNGNNQANEFVGTTNQRFDAYAGSGTGFGTPYNGAAFSMEAWIKPTVDSYGTLVGRANHYLSLIQTGTNTDAKVEFNFEDSAGGQFFISSHPIQFPIAQILHVVGIYDGTTAILYINGVEITRTISVGVGGMRSLPDSPPQIGGAYAGVWPQAVVDEVAWYNTVLAPTRVLAHYQAGRPPTPYDTVIDADNPVSHWKLGNSEIAVDRKGVRNLPAVGGPITAVSGITANNDSDKANQLVGTVDQYFGVSDNTDFGTPYDGAAYSMETWVKPTADAYGRILTRSLLALSLAQTGTGTEVQLTFTILNSASVDFQILSPVKLPVGQSSHVVGTYDGTTFILYVNGVEVIRSSSVGVGGVRSLPNTPPQIGAPFTSLWPRVVVDEAVWYNSALAPTRVLAHYQAGQSGTVYNDSRTATGTVSGAKTEAYSHDGSSSGTVVASGSGIEVYSAPIVYTDAASGIVTASGSSTESRVYGDSATYYDNVIDADNPVSHWKLGDPSTAVDRRGLQNLPAVSGPVGTTTGIVANNASDQANVFTGVANVAFNSGTGTNRGAPYNGEYTIETWLTPTADSSGTIIKRTPGTVLDLANTGSGTRVSAVFSFENSANVSFDLVTPSLYRLTVNKTSHVAATYDGTTAILYINGVEAIRTTSVGVGGIRSSLTTPPFIGAGSGGAWPVAVVDEVAWYPAALSPARILAHYQAGTVDVGTPRPTITVTGTGIESYELGGSTYTDVASGAIIAQGPATETYVGTDSAVGTIVASGTKIESYVHDASVSGIVTASGSGVESYICIDSRSSVVIVSGPSTETFSVSDSNAGTITSSGTSTETYSYTDTGTGVIAASGSGTESYGVLIIYTDARSGTGIASGTGTEAYSYTDTGTSIVTASGVRAETFSASDTSSGTVTTSGTRTEVYSYADTGTATVTAKGTGIEEVAYVAIGIGTTVATGSGSESASYADSVSGAATTNGTGSETAVRNTSATGTIVVNGTGIDSRVYDDAISGTGLVSGSGVDSSEILVGYADATSGQINANGTSVESQTHTSTAIGFIVANGTSVESQVHTNTAIGSVVVNGSRIESHSHTSTAIGFVFVEGTASESYGVSYDIIYTDIAVGIVTSTGTGVDSIAYSNTATGTIKSTGTSEEEVSYSNTATGTITWVDSSTESASYEDASSGIIAFTGSSDENYGYKLALQPVPFSTVIALNRIHVEIWNKTPIQAKITNTIPLVQITLQRQIKVDARKLNRTKVLIANR